MYACTLLSIVTAPPTYSAKTYPFLSIHAYIPRYIPIVIYTYISGWHDEKTVKRRLHGSHGNMQPTACSADECYLPTCIYTLDMLHKHLLRGDVLHIYMYITTAEPYIRASVRTRS